MFFKKTKLLEEKLRKTTDDLNIIYHMLPYTGYVSGSDRAVGAAETMVKKHEEAQRLLADKPATKTLKDKNKALQNRVEGLEQTLREKDAYINGLKDR